jgi:hypothetical protein
MAFGRTPALCYYVGTKTQRNMHYEFMYLLPMLFLAVSSLDPSDPSTEAAKRRMSHAESGRLLWRLNDRQDFLAAGVLEMPKNYFPLVAFIDSIRTQQQCLPAAFLLSTVRFILAILRYLVMRNMR